MTTDEVLKALGRYAQESCEGEASDGNKTRLGPKVVKLVNNCRKHAVHKKVNADAAKQKSNAASTKQVSETKK